MKNQNSGIRFIRVRGRIVPVRSRGEAAWSAGKKGAKIGAGIGTAAGVLLAGARTLTDIGPWGGKFGKAARFGIQGLAFGGIGAIKGALDGVALGGVYGALTFREKRKRK